MKVGAIIYDVSQDLNDQEIGYEYLVWRKEQLRSYLQEILPQLAQQFKKLFYTQRIVRVKAGGMWHKACDCEQIVRVLGEVTADGQQLISTLTDMVDNSRLTWHTSRRHCTTAREAGDYHMTGVSINTAHSYMFRVYPPIPRGEPDHFVLLECYVGPTRSDDDYDIPNRLVALIKEWMLFRAYSVDSENNQATLQVAGNHYKAYQDLLTAERQVLEKEENEYSNLRTVSDDSLNRAP